MSCSTALQSVLITHLLGRVVGHHGTAQLPLRHILPTDAEGEGVGAVRDEPESHAVSPTWWGNVLSLCFHFSSCKHLHG